MARSTVPQSLATATLVATLALGACAERAPAVDPLDAIATDYVKLALAVGQHDDGYIDAYHGPDAWQQEADSAGKRPLTDLRAEAARLLAALDAIAAGARRDDGSRWAYLAGQLDAIAAHCARLDGVQMSFDDEAEALYQVRPQHEALESFDADLAALSEMLPGEGTVQDRYQRYRERFVIPREKLDAVFQAAIAEARRRTAERIALPAGESFTVEYVNDKPWTGYNWYQGSGRSLIQVNTDQPIHIDRALDLAAHEGYPGHHLYNALLEANLLDAPPAGKGWIEFSVYPLYSPQSLIAEGSANFGIEVAFPGAERVRFEREVLYPLSGIDPAEAERYAEVQRLTKHLAFAGNEVARELLEGRIDDEAAAALLVRYGLMEPGRAAQRVRFMRTYRSYVINYNVGERLVADWVERQGGVETDPDARWAAFLDLISSPRLPASLAPR